MADKKKTVTIVLSERQANIVLMALEEWFRLRMGQAGTHDLANDLAFSTYDRSKDKDGHSFNLTLQRRDDINHILKAIFLIAWGGYGVPERRSEPELIAGDIWSQLRWELGPKNEWQPMPFRQGPEPLPKITVEVCDA